MALVSRLEALEAQVAELRRRLDSPEAHARYARREPEGPRPLGVALEWLSAELSAGPRLRRELLARARLEGVAERTLERARRRLRVLSLREPGSSGRGPSYWALPRSSSPSSPR